MKGPMLFIMAIASICLLSSLVNGNSIAEDIMIFGNGIGHFTTGNDEIKEKAIGQGTQSYSKRLNWSSELRNYSFGSDYILQPTQKNIWNQYLLAASSDRVGWQDQLRASNLGNFTGAGRIELDADSLDTQYYMQGEGTLQGKVVDFTTGKPEWVTTTYANGSFIINRHTNISKPKYLPTDWLAFCNDSWLPTTALKPLVPLAK